MSQTVRSLALLLAAASLSAADVTAQASTYLQYWKLGTQAESRSAAPLTQFLGIDVSGLGSQGLSLSLYGWGRQDLADPSGPEARKTEGALVYGYVAYRFAKANGELQAGRIFVSEGGVTEQMDGLRARADLRGGLTLSIFGGRPSLDNLPQEAKRDFLAGARLGARLASLGELGISYLTDGPKPLEGTSPYPSRQLAGADLHFVPHPMIELKAKASYHTGLKAMAEQDYALAFRPAPVFSLTLTSVARDFQSYYAGTNLPLLFRTDTLDKQRSSGARLQIGSGPGFMFLGDFKHTDRETFGKSDRYGGEFRLGTESQKLLFGLGYHRVAAPESGLKPEVVNNPALPFFGLSHHEMRGWLFFNGERVMASLDAILHRYDDKDNPNLNGQASVFEGIASLGWKQGSWLTLSGDISYGANPRFEREVRGTLRVELRFGKRGGEQ